MSKAVLVALVPLALALGYGVTTMAPSADAAPGKNLQVYPKTMDTKAIKDDMKKMAKGLGVQCDYCHDMSALDKDTDMKKKARDMMKMSVAINAQMKKGGFKQQVSCATCHAGQKKPKN